jgi:tetratricopeptide (TPR) repeat protein
VPAALTRLTRIQYAHQVRDLFGPEVVVPARLEPDVLQAGFSSVGATRTSVSPRGVEQYEAAALDEARRAFEAELALNPYDAVAEYQIAQILEARQDSAGAAKRLERAIEINPEFAEALIALARYRTRRNESAEAARLLERAVELQPRSEGAWYALMTAYRNGGRREDAVRAKQRLDELQKSPDGEFVDFLSRIGEPTAP